MSNGPFVWSLRDRRRLVEGATVTYFDKDNQAGSLTVQSVGAHPSDRRFDYVFDKFGGNIPLVMCDSKTIIDPPRKKFKWDVKQRAQLALAQHVEVPGVGRVGVSTVDFSALAQRWVLFTTDGARIDLEDVDPSTIGPRHDDRSAPSIEVYRALDRLDLLFSTNPPDFSVVSEEDRTAWKLVSNLLRK